MLIQSMKDVTNPINILGYWNGMQSERQPYLVDQLLQDYPVNQSTINIFYGADKPVDGMQLSPNNAKVTPEGSGSFDSVPVNLMQFKAERVMDEERQDQLDDLLASNSNNQVFIQSLVRNEFNDASKLLDSGHKQREIMFLQALTKGRIDIATSSNRKSVDFNMPDYHKLGVSGEWGTDDGRPITNLQDAVQFIANDNNTQESIAIMNDHTLNALAQSKEVKNTLLPNSNNGDLAINQTDAKQLVKERTGLDVLQYSKTTRDANGIEQRMIPDGKVVLIPAGFLGRMAWKPTNEQRMLSDKSDVQIANSGDGITLASYNSINPAGLFTLASQKILPAVDKMQNILTLDAFTPTDSTSKSTVAPLSTMGGNQSTSTRSSSNNSNQSTSSSSK